MQIHHEKKTDLLGMETKKEVVEKKDKKETEVKEVVGKKGEGSEGGGWKRKIGRRGK